MADEGRTAHVQDQESPPSPIPIPKPARPAWATALICLAILGLAGFIARGGHNLWREWSDLQRVKLRVRTSVLIGYININPNPSHATPPARWVVVEGDQARLWAGWDGRDHRWFRYDRRGAIDFATFSHPIGRDVIQAVDRPIHEEPGGDFWARIPDEAPVAVVAIGERASLYPMKVLEKVGAVNDRVGDRPILVAYTPIEGHVTTYERSIGGREVLLAHSGYFLGHDLVFYDHETESLWVAREGGMAAVAGSRRGDRLPAIGRTPTRDWATCRAENPQGRLMIGAHRDYDEANRWSSACRAALLAP